MIDILLFISSLLLVFLIVKNPMKGLVFYLYLVSFIGVIGMARTSLLENIIVPLSILIALLIRKLEDVKEKNKAVVLFCFTMLLASWFNGFSGYDNTFMGVYLGGLILIFVFDKLIINVSDFIKIIKLFWLCEFALLLRLVLQTPEIFWSFGDMRTNSIEELRFVNTSSISGIANSIDPNYLALNMGLGVIIGLFYLLNRSIFKELIFKKKKSIFFHYFIVLVLVMEFWVSLRGLSRGALLLWVVLIFTNVVYFSRKNVKYIIYTVISAIALIFIVPNFQIYELFNYRFDSDKSIDGGRGDIALNVFEIASDDNFSLMFGHGIDFPYWEYLIYNGRNYYSTHNSFLTILVFGGIISLLIFTYILISGMYYNFKKIDLISGLRMNLLIWLFLWCLTLEPLTSLYPAWFILAIAITKFRSKELSLIKINT